ncbi:carbohydrate ABC transporter permease [Ruegeria jejuensis]|uniref:carbohydrate ABC transporter permease n=1 Tax=Ruegeria jejuensis TaxID=3233338 RepID=UPI00355AF684
MSSDRFWRYATLAPAIALFICLTILPLANLGALSFHKVEWLDRVAVWEWVGLKNYAKLGSDTLFRAGILNTIIFSIVAVAFQMILGFWLALLCTRIKRLRQFYRTVFILPILVPGIIIGAIWKLMYSYDFGVINQLIALFGIAPVDWLGNPDLALLSVIIVDVWHWTPFCFLLMLASLESLPTDVQEAARIDGANNWQVLRYIILPLMLPAIIVTFVFRMILAFKVFDEIYLLTGGGPGTATEVISFTIYRRFFTEDQSGYGAAMSLATIAVVALLIVLAMRLSNRREAE